MESVSRDHVGRGIAVFEIDGRVFTVDDVVCAAAFFGTLRPCRDELRAGVAAEGRARNLGLDPSVGRLQSMSDAFRYEHDLITAEETESWLERRGLTVDDFNEFILRHYWMEEAPEDPPDRDEEATADLDPLLVPELVLSGAFDRMAASLSRRLALARADESRSALPPEAMESARSGFLERASLTEAGIPGWLAGLGVDRAWLEQMLRLDEAYRRRCAALLHAKARERALQALRLSLTRIEVEVLQLGSEDAAREAFLCVGQDGVEMADLARECGHPYRRVGLRLGDLDEELYRVFLSAAPGEVLEPMEEEGTFRLCRLAGKTEPDLADAETRERVDARIVDSFFGELTARHVRWLLERKEAE